MRALRIAAGLIFAGATAVIALLIALPVFGFHHYVITGGSMTGAFNRGSLVLERDVPTQSLRVGDVITYAPPADAAVRGLVTHRIVWIGHDNAGRVFRTKGDANSAVDPWTFHLTSSAQPRVAAHISGVGYVFGYLSQPGLRLLLVGLPAAALAVSLFVGLWQDAGRELRERDASLT
ncbi:MAG TPA: signal peptidase I [Mycobacteriales bacterium]|jgi:signal peptidase I|nr:signal peptidase I [Mycobacteriales bacterium]HVX69484.1 signal peptidase I [Mycobacteriales bacterium]